MNFTILITPIYFVFSVFTKIYPLRTSNSTLYISNSTDIDDDYQIDDFNLQWIYNQ